MCWLSPYRMTVVFLPWWSAWITPSTVVVQTVCISKCLACCHLMGVVLPATNACENVLLCGLEHQLLTPAHVLQACV